MTQAKCVKPQQKKDVVWWALAVAASGPLLRAHIWDFLLLAASVVRFFLFLSPIGVGCPLFPELADG